MILTFHSCFSSISNDWYLSILFSFLSWMSYLLALRSQWFLVVDQHDVRPIVKQMLIRLNGEVPENLGMIVPEYFFWFCSPVFTVLKDYSAHMSPVYYWGHLVVSLSGLGSCEFAAVADDMCHCLCKLLAQPASGILHSVVDLVCHCPGVEDLLLSCHD